MTVYWLFWLIGPLHFHANIGALVVLLKYKFPPYICPPPISYYGPMLRVMKGVGEGGDTLAEIGPFLRTFTLLSPNKMARQQIEKGER